jgi:diguanylate cyclase (GGDEF)-like protein
MPAFLLNSLLEISTVSVSGGFVVALAVICLVQYLAYMHRVARLRGQQEQFQLELAAAGEELDTLHKDRALTRYECQALREFLSASSFEQAIRKLLARFVGDPAAGLAFFLRQREGEWVVAHGYGLAPATMARVVVDPKLAARLGEEPYLCLEGARLHESQLWQSLEAVDRAKILRLHLLAVGSKNALMGVLVTSALVPPSAPIDRQRELTVRVMAAVGASLHDKFQLVSKQDELRATAEMLELRQLTDRKHESPLAMIKEFIGQVATRIQADRAVLMLYTAEAGAPVRLLFRAGPAHAGQPAEGCLPHEEVLAASGRPLVGPVQYEAAELASRGIGPEIGCALLIPVVRNERTSALLCYLRDRPIPFPEARRRMAVWSAEVLADLVPRVANQAVVERQARHDALTGVANRRAFDRQFEHDLEVARCTGQPCSLLLFDLDHFKQINDTHGHRAGDEVLRQFAAQLQDCVKLLRAQDRMLGVKPFVARFGGEEFVLLLPGLGLPTGRRLAELIRAGISSRPIEFEDAQINVTTSVGLAAFPEHGATPDQLLAAADGALYHAKDAGRNRLGVAEPALAALA